MSRIRDGAVLAGVGAILFSVFSAPVSVVSLFVPSAPGGTYSESDVVNYISMGFLPTVIVTGYLALLGVMGLICLLAHLREMIAADAGNQVAAGIFWGSGLAAAASMAVGWGLLTGIAVAAAEGGSAASVSHPVVYFLSDTSKNVLFGSGGVLLGFALIALMVASRGLLPSWLRWLTLVAGVLAIASPALFPAFAIPIWGIVVGVWVTAGNRASRTASLA